MLRKKFDEIQRPIEQTRGNSRLWKLANCCIFGSDANDRMARTSKMNMIMPGDGYGGVHHHNGFINVNGIFEGRFDIVLTNPPFEADVEPSDHVAEADIAITDEEYQHYTATYGDLYEEAQARVQMNVGKPIASLFAKGFGFQCRIQTDSKRLIFIILPAPTSAQSGEFPMCLKTRSPAQNTRYGKFENFYYLSLLRRLLTLGSS